MWADLTVIEKFCHNFAIILPSESAVRIMYQEMEKSIDN